MNSNPNQLTSYQLQANKGFTLLEVLLSIAVVAVLAGFSLPIFRTMLTKNDLDVATVTVAQTLRRTQILSQAVDGDTSWGIKVQSGTITLFRGTSYGTRDSSFDETFDLPTSINPSGTTEIVYAKFTGLPQTTGSIIFSTANDTKTISVNEKGTVNY